MQKILIDTERLQIRKLKTKDLADFHFYRSNPEVQNTRDSMFIQLNKPNNLFKSNKTKNLEK